MFRNKVQTVCHFHLMVFCIGQLHMINLHSHFGKRLFARFFSFQSILNLFIETKLCGENFSLNGYSLPNLIFNKNVWLLVSLKTRYILLIFYKCQILCGQKENSLAINNNILQANFLNVCFSVRQFLFSYYRKASIKCPLWISTYPRPEIIE